MTTIHNIGGVRFRLDIELHVPSKNGNHEVWLTAYFPTGDHDRKLLLAVAPERERDACAFHDGAKMLLETVAKSFE